MDETSFSKGDIIVVPFPFSDLTGSKKRPALILAVLPSDNIVICQITGEARTDEYAVLLKEKDFTEGGLQKVSRIRPNKIFTTNRSIFLYKVGSIHKSKLKEVETILINIFTK